MIRQFKLMKEQEEEEEKEEEREEGRGGRKPGRLEQVREMQYDQPAAEEVSEKPAASFGNIFTCVGEAEEESSGEFEYVWVNGRLEKRAKQGKKGKGLKCKLVPGGMRKVKAMEKKLKAISKDLKRFSRILGQFSPPEGGR